MKWTLLKSGLVMLATAGIATTASAQGYGHHGTPVYQGHTRTVYDVHHGNYTDRHHGNYVENHGSYRDVHHGNYIERHHGNFLMRHSYSYVQRRQVQRPRILLHRPARHFTSRQHIPVLRGHGRSHHRSSHHR